MQQVCLPQKNWKKLLNKPIYEKSAAYGHFGREPEGDGSFSWEKTDKKSIFSK